MTDQDQAIRAFEVPLIAFAAFLALSTAAVLAGLHLRAEFVAVVVAVGACGVASIAIVSPRLIGVWRSLQQGRADWRVLLAAVLVCFAYAVAALAINRPDIDDSIYVPPALHLAANLFEPIDLSMPWLADLPAGTTVLDLHVYETIQAAVSVIAGRPFLDIFHIGFPALAGFLMAASFLLLISRFEPDPWRCLLSVAFLLAVVLALGETHSSYGNLSIARLFHAKYVMLAVFVPAWSYFSLRFLADGSRWAWGVLALIAAGMAGITSTALVFLPFLAVVLAGAHQLSSPRPLAPGRFGWSFVYGLSLFPLVILALRYYLIAAGDLGPGTVLHDPYPRDVAGQIAFLINWSLPLTFILFAAATALVLWRSPHRALIGFWVALPVVLFLNPWSGGLLMETVVPPAIFWRLFYLLPFPLVVALAFAILLREGRKGRVAAAASFAVTAVLCVAGPTAVVRAENGVTLEWPSYSIAPATRRAVADIAAAVDLSETMFAPEEISSNMLIISTGRPQFHMREDYLRFVFARTGTEEGFERRSAAYAYLYGGVEAGREALQALIDAPTRPNVFVVRSEDASRVAAVLTPSGYEQVPVANDGYVIYRSRN